MAKRVFLLSPANCGGIRAQMVLSEAAQFALARQLRTAEGAPLGEVFSFVSGLYFRGKLAYARRFAQPPDPTDPVSAGGVLVITPNAGLRAADLRVTVESMRAFAGASIDLKNAAYRAPLERGARALLDAIGADCEVVLLGSIASGKYVELLLPIFGDKLMFPPAFVGRGDMSRGGLMLRCVTAGLELDYAPIRGAIRHGERPPKLEPLRRRAEPEPVLPPRGSASPALPPRIAESPALPPPVVESAEPPPRRRPERAPVPAAASLDSPVPPPASRRKRLVIPLRRRR